MKDQTTTISELKKRVIDFRDERGWKRFNTVRSLALSIFIELGELVEHFQWGSEDHFHEKMKEKSFRDEVRFEMADVLVYLITLSDDLGIDLSEAIHDKQQIQANKFPVEKMKSWAGKSEKEIWMEYQSIKREYRQKKD